MTVTNLQCWEICTSNLLFVEVSVVASKADGIWSHLIHLPSFLPQYAAERLGLISERCILIGNCNKTVEAAHDAMMKVRIGYVCDAGKKNPM